MGKRMKIIDSFEKQASGVEHVDEITKHDGTKVPVYLINSFHTLTQFVGYAKYKNRFYGNVYLRGQTLLHSGKLIPSVFRPFGGNSIANYSERFHNYNSRKNIALKETPAFDGINKQALEALLQHYGVKTTWLDIVDNLWIALWFGLHNFDSITLQSHEHIHITEAAPENYAYIFLLLIDAQQEKEEKRKDGPIKIPGVYYGESSYLVDLRKAVQSFYLRPHAQHALMIQKKQILTREPLEQADIDYSDFIVGIAKIPVSTGLDWIGRNGLLSIQSLFPPTYYDHGYRRLLEYYSVDPTAIPTYGSIQLISY